MCAGVAGDEVDGRRVDRLRERVGQAERDGHTQRVTQAPRVLGSDEPLGTGDARTVRAARAQQLGEPGVDLVAAPPAARHDLVAREVAEHPEQVVHLVDVAGPALVDEALQLELQVGERVGVDEVAQLVAAEQLGQQLTVERERRGAPLGERGVALVDRPGHVVEQQRRGERRRLLTVHLVHPDPSCVDAAEQLAERGEVEDVREALAVGLEQDREARVAARHGEQVRGALTLLPQRRAAAGAAAGQQQRTGRTLPEAGGEHRGVRDLVEHEVVDLLHGRQEDLERRRLVRLGQAQRRSRRRRRSSVRRTRALPAAGADRHGPRRVHPSAVRREQTDPPVPDLVPEPLHDHLPVVGSTPVASRCSAR